MSKMPSRRDRNEFYESFSSKYNALLLLPFVSFLFGYGLCQEYALEIMYSIILYYYNNYYGIVIFCIVLVNFYWQVRQDSLLVHIMRLFFLSSHSTFCSSHDGHICSCAWYNSRPRTQGGRGNDSSSRLSRMHQNLCQQ